ncbi:DcaP family trimeric outer membrane transporter [Ferrimonas senticii]|uniref:DcaP family trimeric outer membrane transporter n=1 Tax=Ferrimonas senticii TaxID=394566 RepID=UPI0004891E5E|nr:DcaP family trimeric outer membrane transporter [Ferrimonas senticii]
MMSRYNKWIVLGSLLIGSTPAIAGYEFDLGDGHKLKFGGYLKVDARYVDGDVGYQDFWLGRGGPIGDNSKFKIFANETRFNTTYTHGDVSAFLEMDFFVSPGGNEVISNSYNPRLRHAFINYQNWLVGQTWTTFMNTSAIPETADFAGGNAGLAFVRQGMIRYSAGGFQLAIENPETSGGGADNSNEEMPDIIGKYVASGDWGNVSGAVVARQLNFINSNTSASDDDMAFGYSLAGKLNVFGKDDLRFQIHAGETGRYATINGVADVVNNQAQESVSYMAAYRHFWTNTLRSTVLYAGFDADGTDDKVSQWSVNLFQNLTKELSVGFEVGNFMYDPGASSGDYDSFYGQFSMKYVL